MNKFDIIIIGAGAAGLIAAGRAAELGAKVLLVEKMNKPALKLLMTGNGRCNITNTAPLSKFYSHIYPNGKFLQNVFNKFFNTDVVYFFKHHNLNTIVEDNGRVFPASHKSSDVLNVLMNWLDENKVEIKYNCRAEKLILENNVVKGVEVLDNDTLTSIYSDNLFICTGGNSYPSTGSTGDGYKLAKDAGHTIETIKPALVPLKTAGDIAERLMGLALKDIKIAIWVNGKKKAESSGEMLFTHFGLSGPLIINASRYVVEELINNNKVELKIDLKPEIDEQSLDKEILEGLNKHGKMQIKNFLSLHLSSRLVDVFLEILNIDSAKECHQINSKERKKISLLMKAFPFVITGHRSFKEAMVTAGGVSTKEINPQTMESKIIKNLYFAGEIIDIDADTGGYNLQIAWSTGWVAANACMNQDIK